VIQLRALGIGLLIASAALAAQTPAVNAVRARAVQGSSTGSLQVTRSASGQITSISRSGTGTVSISGGAVPPELMAQTSGASGGEAAAPTPRLAPLQQMQFDRRPSAILAAWAELDKAPEVAAEKNASGEEDGGEVVEIESLGYATSGVVGVAPTTPVITAPVATAPTTTQPVAAQPSVPAQPSTAAQPSATAQPNAEAQPAEAATPEAATAAAAAEEARKKAEEEAKKKADEAKAIEKEFADLRRNVTLGRWSEVGTYLKGISKPEGEAGYTRMLQSLVQGPQVQVPDMPPQGRMFMERNQFSPVDVVGLAAAAPRELTPDDLKLLGQLLHQALDSGHQLGAFLREVAPRIDAPSDGIARRALARLLVAADQPLGLESLIPTLDQAVQSNDREALNLIARFALARHAEQGKSQWLEEAWHATQAALATGEIDLEAKREALTRAVEIAPRVAAELGQTWLDESFTARPERGMEILATIGGAASQALSMKPMDSDARLKLLKLQTTAAKALLTAAPELAGQWSAELSLLAANWLREAQHSYQFDESTSRGPRMQRDAYGNVFWYDMGYGGRNNGMAAAIKTGDLLEIRPSDAWLAHVDATLRPRLSMIYAQLLLKVSEEAEAFPYIEALAASDPRPAKELVDEFLRVWANNHNPNQASSRSSQYVYFFGYEERSGSIPLTRSKQERNLAELAQWVTRLRALPVEIDDQLLTKAFQSAHSSAEIYRLETIEQVFGPLAKLEPKTLAALVQTMRTNLGNIWRDPAAQRDAKTNRRQQDIQTEVLRGYELANATLDTALRDHPASWELQLARASLAHDENNYQAEIKKDSEFSSRRSEAMELFHRAADSYAAGVGALDKDDESVDVYQMWFYAALGASDLRAVDPKAVLLSAEIPRIKAAIDALPGERAERHRAAFASTLFARMSNANPAVKFRYVREGLAIVGDHPLAREAKAVFDYYSDLVTEIQLAARVDGSGSVGTTEPFGLRVDLRHTAAIERESGGFAKYLQNQNSQAYGFNYGRPLEDYRDKFEEAARATLSEHFEVLSATFNDPKARSSADPEYGWRITPYAYLLLKPRGPQIDVVPPLRLDLDFLDTSGYAVLPVESSPVAISASSAGDERPYERLTLTQTLDERRSKDGKLVLEIKAGALGLVPPLATLLDLAPEGFDITKTDDHGTSVVKFDEERDGVVSERTWTLELHGKEGLASPPTKFAFGTPRVETQTDEHFRYVDADLATVGPIVDLEARYSKADRGWVWWGLGGVALVGAAIYFGRRFVRPRAAEAARFQVPETVNAFTVLGVLRDIQSRNGLTPDAHSDLQREIAELEAFYFGDGRSGDETDLRRVAERWVARAR